MGRYGSVGEVVPGSDACQQEQAWEGMGEGVYDAS